MPEKFKLGHYQPLWWRRLVSDRRGGAVSGQLLDQVLTD